MNVVKKLFTSRHVLFILSAENLLGLPAQIGRLREVLRNQNNKIYKLNLKIKN